VAYDRGVREKAIALRAQGLSYREIRQEVGVATSTLSVWLSGVPLTEEHRSGMELRARGVSAARADTNRALGSRRRADTHEAAKAEIGRLSEEELFVAGVVAYWAEGAKNKPWRNGQPVQFLNSDPGLIRVFLAWLRMVEVTSDRLVFRLRIHESADVAGALEHWSGVVEVPTERITVSLKRHNPRTVRKNIGSGYHGCLSVSVRRSSALNVRIAGWCEGLGVQAAGVLAAGSLASESGVV
jgi:hypothetical protein